MKHNISDRKQARPLEHALCMDSSMVVTRATATNNGGPFRLHHTLQPHDTHSNMTNTEHTQCSQNMEFHVQQIMTVKVANPFHVS